MFLVIILNSCRKSQTKSYFDALLGLTERRIECSVFIKRIGSKIYSKAEEKTKENEDSEVEPPLYKS